MAYFRDITEQVRLERAVSSKPGASVWRAFDPGRGSPVAVKLIPMAGGPEDAPSFVRAMGALQDLHHPSLPALLDFGFTPDGKAFLVFEWADGRGLDALSGGSPAQILPALIQAIDGIEALGRLGLAHHNLSPDNLLLTTRPDGFEVLLTGLGTALLRPAEARVAGGGGAAAFAAPEVGTAGEAAAGPASDLYSLALVACVLLGARVHGSGQAAPKVSLPLGVSFELEDDPALVAILERALLRDPAERPSCDEMRAALGLALYGAAGPRPSPPLATRLILTPTPEDALLAEALASSGMGAAMEGGAHDPGDDTNPVFLETAVRQALATAATPASAASATHASTDPASETLVGTVMPPALRPAGLAGAAALTASIAPAAPESAPLPPPLPSLTPLPDLPSLDEELFAPLPAPVALTAPAPQLSTPPSPSTTAAAPSAAPSAMTAASALVFAAAVPPPVAAAHQRRGILVAAGAALAVLAIAAIAFWLSSREIAPAPVSAPPGTRAAPAHPPGAPSSTRTALVPVAPAPLPAALADAAAAFAEGKDDEARQAIAAVRDEGDLPPAACAAYLALGSSLEAAGHERLAGAFDNLHASLRAGNLAQLREAVRRSAALGGERALVRQSPGLARDLAQARQAVDLADRLDRAVQAGDQPQVISLAGELAAVLPRYAGAPAAREGAAAAIETDAEAQFHAGNVGAALARVEALRRAWPDRPGLAERAARYAAEQRSDQGLQSTLAEAEAAAERKRPDEGLAILRAARPNERNEARFRETRARLERELAVLDKAPPVIQLASPQAEYEKGSPARIAFRVTDDFSVKSVAVHARAEGTAGYVELQPARSGSDYTVEVPPSLHQNRTIEFYVVATDLSGHRGELGSAPAPRQMRRKKWYEKLLNTKPAGQ